MYQSLIYRLRYIRFRYIQLDKLLELMCTYVLGLAKLTLCLPSSSLYHPKKLALPIWRFHSYYWFGFSFTVPFQHSPAVVDNQRWDIVADEIIFQARENAAMLQLDHLHVARRWRNNVHPRVSPLTTVNKIFLSHMKTKA